MCTIARFLVRESSNMPACAAFLRLTAAEMTARRSASAAPSRIASRRLTSFAPKRHTCGEGKPTIQDSSQRSPCVDCGTFHLNRELCFLHAVPGFISLTGIEQAQIWARDVEGGGFHMANKPRVFETNPIFPFHFFSNIKSNHATTWPFAG